MNANRYSIIMFYENVTKSFVSEEEYKDFLLEYNKNNKNPNNLYTYGNFKIISDIPRVIKYTVYKKITKATPLEVIDSIVTEKYEDEESLKLKYKNDVSGGKGKLYIGYMYKGQVKTLPLFYKKDKKYVNLNEIEKIILDNILTEPFLSKIWTNSKLNQTEYRKSMGRYLETIQIEYGKYVMKKVDSSIGIENAVRNFISYLCKEEGKINQRRVRELGSIVKNILDSKDKNKQISEPRGLEGKNKKPLTRKMKPQEKENDLRLF